MPPAIVIPSATDDQKKHCRNAKVLGETNIEPPKWPSRGLHGVPCYFVGGYLPTLQTKACQSVGMTKVPRMVHPPSKSGADGITAKMSRAPRVHSLLIPLVVAGGNTQKYHVACPSCCKSWFEVLRPAAQTGILKIMLYRGYTPHI